MLTLRIALYLLSLSVFRVTLAAKWLLLGRALQAGAHIPRGSAQEVARECAHRLNALVTSFVLLHLWGGLGTTIWYRLMVARIGSGMLLSMGVVLSDWDSVDIGPVCLLGAASTLETSTISGCPETGDLLVKGFTFEQGVTTCAGSYVSAGSKLAQRVVVGVFSCVAADSHVSKHTMVVGTKPLLKSRAKRCFVPKDRLPWNLPWVKELASIVIYTAWTVLAVWAAMYAVWWLRDKASWPAAVLFPLGASLYQLLQLLLIVLKKWAVARNVQASMVKEKKDLEVASFGAFARMYLQMLLSNCYNNSVLGKLMSGGQLQNLYLRSLRRSVHMDAFINSTRIFDC